MSISELQDETRTLSAPWTHFRTSVLSARGAIRSRFENGVIQTLQYSLRFGVGLHGAFLHFIHLLKFLLDPYVPHMEWNLILLTLLVELTRRYLSRNKPR